MIKSWRDLSRHALWNKEGRREKFVLFSISGFADRLREIASGRGDLLLVGGDGEICN